ncbi:VOC family protein [Streptomyces milbemycinicus]|uniref:VOC family protein n=1 Tax=Streptomyces milbemycinicus TaxID=476552 RepID=UPI0033D12116
MATDLDRAQSFYGDLFGWHFRPSRHGHGRYTIAFTQDGAPTVGMGVPAATGVTLPVTWTTYFAADSADEIAWRARERGGTVAVGPLEFGSGRVAWAADPDGAVFGIWEGELTSAWWGERRPGAPVWLELRTRDAFEAALFYGHVFGWDAQGQDRCDVRFEHDRVVLHIDGKAVAGLRGGALEATPDPNVRPRWHVYFCVDDVDRVAAQATALGGGIISAPADTPYGRIAALRDPEGGLFSIAASTTTTTAATEPLDEGEPSYEAGSAHDAGSSYEAGSSYDAEWDGAESRDTGP